MPARQPIAGHELTGPIAEAINDALYREGILVDQRARVLKRLGSQPVMQASVEFVDMWYKNREDLVGYVEASHAGSLYTRRPHPQTR
jgi:hypothetical protein